MFQLLLLLLSTHHAAAISMEQQAAVEEQLYRRIDNWEDSHLDKIATAYVFNQIFLFIQHVYPCI